MSRFSPYSTRFPGTGTQVVGFGLLACISILWATLLAPKLVFLKQVGLNWLLLVLQDGANFLEDYLFYAYDYFACMYGCEPHVCMCVPGACGSQKMVSDPLELELQIVVSCHVSAGSWT